MIRVIRKRTLDVLTAKADEFDAMVKAQEEARAALSSPNRAERRRAHRSLWSELPKPEESRA